MFIFVCVWAIGTALILWLDMTRPDLPVPSRAEFLCDVVLTLLLWWLVVLLIGHNPRWPTIKARLIPKWLGRLWAAWRAFWSAPAWKE